MTWTIKTRGARGVMLAEYLCPAHGRFEATVDRDANGDPPEWSACIETRFEPEACREFCRLVISAPRIKQPMFVSANHGKNDEPPGPWAMDTELIADGKMTTAEWRKHREAMWRAHDADSDPDRPKKVYSR